MNPPVLGIRRLEPNPLLKPSLLVDEPSGVAQALQVALQPLPPRAEEPLNRIRGDHRHDLRLDLDRLAAARLLARPPVAELPDRHYRRYTITV